MKLSYVRIDGLKGSNVGFEVTEPCLALVGPMGSGKSTVIDGINFALNLPTPYGNKALDRLSPTGQWCVTLMFDHPDVQRLERAMLRRGSSYKVNGIKVTSKEYADAVSKVVCVEPHHCLLSEFLGLSGEKRAALFSKILESSDKADISQVVKDQTGTDIDTYFQTKIGVGNMGYIRSTIDGLRTITGTAAQLTEAVKQSVNTARTREQDAKIRLEGLIEQAGGLSHGMTPAEVQIRLSEADGELGSLKDRKSSIDVERERYESSQRVLETARKTVEEKRGALDELRKISSEGDKAQTEYESACTDLKHQIERQDAAQADADLCTERCTEIEKEIRGINESANLVTEVVKRDWNVDQEWFEVEWKEFEESLDIEVQKPTNEICTHALSLAKEIVQEVLGGTVDRLVEQKTDAESRLEAANQQKAASNESLVSTKKARASQEGKVDTQIRIVKKITVATESIEEAERSVEASDKERAELEQAAQRTAVPTDEVALDEQISVLQEKRDAIAKQLSELTEHKAISGQVETARLDVAVTQVIHTTLKDLVALIQTWRDVHVSDAMGNVMAPFQERFSILFGQEVQIAHHSAGSGRSTEFYFTVSRNGVPVDLDLYSDGETVLTAAAFLSALQSIKDGPGSILMLNDLGLDDRGCELFLNGAPRLGLDFVAIATSRIGDLSKDGARGTNLDCDVSGWQFVDMETPPDLRR